MKQYYKFLNKEIKIYEMNRIPNIKGIFLHDKKYKNHWGSCIDTIYCPDGFLVGYELNEETNEETLFAELKGNRSGKQLPIYYNNSYCITNKSGAYVCIYNVGSGNIFRSASTSDVHIVFHAKFLSDRELGDQLAQIFVPDDATAYKKDNIDYIS